MDAQAQAKKVAILAAPLVSVAAILFVLNFTNPISVGPAGVLVVFILLYLLLSSLLYGALRALGMVTNSFFKRSLTRKQSAYMGCVLAFGPLLLIALNTLGNIGIVEVVLVTLLVVLGCFYVSRRSIGGQWL